MNPKSYFESNANPVRNGFLYALVTKETVEAHGSEFRSAADTRKFDLEYSLGSKSNASVWENIQVAEAILFDFSKPSTNLYLLLGIALMVKESENVVVVANQEDILKDLPVSGDYYDPKKPNSLREILELKLTIIASKRPSTIVSPTFKSPENKTIVNAAMEATLNRNWLLAETLFESVLNKEPNHWYVLAQWGILLREQRMYEQADEKFSMALAHTKFDSEKAEIYVEKAKMQQSLKDQRGADQWFEKARSIDPKNVKIYFAWAIFWDECNEPTRAATKILDVLNQVDSNNKDASARYRYYSKKIVEPSYKKNFEEFLLEERVPVQQVSKTVKPPKKKPPFIPNMNAIRYDISWEEFRERGVGKILEGTVQNVVKYGVFVTLTRDFNGLIHESRLPAGFHQSFVPNQRIRVRVMSAVLDNNNNKPMIDLELIQA